MDAVSTGQRAKCLLASGKCKSMLTSVQVNICIILFACLPNEVHIIINFKLGKAIRFFK